ncbi:electron transfer flavoprotein subunit beta/FixA family protein [bacterium]|nr:electron transfer flavoprotein subunit beta/FixA family protein [bacterium]
MNIAVITKVVPDTEARLSLAGDHVDLSSVEMVINPFDEYGLEEALKIKDADENAKVHVLMVGPESARKLVVNCLALGADEAVVIDDEAIDSGNPLAVAEVLAAEIKKLDPTLVFAGKQGVDYDWGLTAVAVAQKLSWPHVGVVKEFTPDFAAGTFTAVTESDEGDLKFNGSLPAVITAEKGLNTPRYASLKGIMKAKKKPFAVHKLADTGADPAAAGTSQSKVEEVQAMHPPAREPGRIIEGEEVLDRVCELVRVLREEAKVL